jgi:selenocysteine lyase/cysteine desulfurase
MPLMRFMGIPGTTRASFSVFNGRDDIQSLIEGVEYAKRTFRI